MTVEEKRNLISENLNLNSSTAAIAVEMLEKQKMFLVAIAKNNYEVGCYETIDEVLEIIDGHIERYVTGRTNAIDVATELRCATLLAAAESIRTDVIALRGEQE